MKDTNRTTNRRTNNDAIARMHAKDYCRTKGGISLVIDIRFHQSYRMMHLLLPSPSFSILPRSEHFYVGSRDVVDSGTDGLSLHEIRLANDLVRNTRDDTASLGK